MNDGTKGNPDSNFDPNRLARGDPFRAFEGLRTWERGTIKSVDPVSYTCDVYTERGKLLVSLPWPSTYAGADGVAGDITAPKVMQPVVVNYNLGEPRIQFASAELIAAVTGPEVTLTGNGRPSGVDKLATGRPNYRGRKPRDIIPGDWVRLGSSGNLVGVLEGGVCVLRGGPASQVIVSGVDDTVRVVSRNLDLMSDFGEVAFTNNEGRVNLSIQGGSQQQEETSPLADDNFTFAADIGAEGDLVNIDVSDPRGVVAYRHHIDPAGNQTTLAGHLDARHTGDTITTVEGNIVSSAAGSRTCNTGTAETINTSGSSVETVQGAKKVSSGQAMRLTSGGKLSLIGGEGAELLATGPQTASPGDTSLDIKVINGDVKFTIGSPAIGDLLKAKSSFAVSTTNGDIDLKTTLGKVYVNSKLPDSIVLGGKTGAFHAVLFEKLKAFLDAYGNLIDTHVHPTIGGPSGPPVVTPYSMSKSLLTLAKSSVVVIPK